MFWHKKEVYEVSVDGQKRPSVKARSPKEAAISVNGAGTFLVRLQGTNQENFYIGSGRNLETLI